MKTPKMAVIPAAGKGTRFLPSTKSTPKEMHPLLNVPLIHHCLLELAEIGVEKVVIVSHPEKNSLEKYFADHSSLKSSLAELGKSELVQRLDSIEKLPQVEFAYQHEQLGLAHAVSCAETHLGNEDFFVLLPDEIFLPNNIEDNPCSQLARLSETTGKSCISLLEVPKDKVSTYGVAEVECAEEGLKVHGIVEKPPVEKAPSNLILPGRYLLKNDILKIIKETPPRGSEVFFTDSLITLGKTDGLYGYVTETPRFDGGSVLGFLKANIYQGLHDPQIKEELKSFIHSLVD